MLGDLGKLIVAKGFKKLPKFQKIARSGHTVHESKLMAVPKWKLYNELNLEKVLQRGLLVMGYNL